jgi:serine protease Do
MFVWYTYVKISMNRPFEQFLKTNKAVIVITLLFNALFMVVVLLLFGTFTGNITSSGPKSEEALTVDVVSRTEPAVVSIIARTDLPQITEEQRRLFEFFLPHFSLPQNGRTQQVGGGSGFFVTADGLIVTNRHVVERESLEYSVVTSDGRSFDARVLAKDPVYDVAIIKIDIENAPYLEFGNSNAVVLGQTVLAIGNALSEFANSVTKVIVSGLSRSVLASGVGGQTEMLENVIQTDAGINPGNSGGPLLDLNGRVIGVNVAVATQSENIGFALPSNLVRSIVDSVLENGEIVVPYIGIRYVLLNEQIAKQQDLRVSEGLLVVRGGPNQPAIIPDSPAEDVGINEGDVITHFNSVPINQKNSFSQMIREVGIGETIELTLVRQGRTLQLSVVLQKAPETFF